MAKFLKLIRNSKGATAIEYGLIAALIAVAAITALGDGDESGDQAVFNRGSTLGITDHLKEVLHFGSPSLVTPKSLFLLKER